jgi:predicted O-methyltransferase YrrM
MEAKLRAMLDELLRGGRSHDAEEPVHSRRLLNLEPETAELLAMLVRAGGRRRVLEIGTSNGYSTIWLAWALRPYGETLTSIERDPGKQEEAAANLERAGLREHVRLLRGDATEVVAGLTDPFDCVFFDADRVSAPRQLELLLPRLAPDVLLAADNVLSHPAEIAGYLDAVATLTRFEHLVVPVGKGLSLAHRSGRRG